jgi:drug/metabolite transporter (DMT)-like permease
MLVSADAVVKFLAPRYPIAEILWLRYLTQTAVLALIFAGRLRGMTATRRPLLQVVRGVLLLAQLFVLYLALRYVPLADASAIVFTAPLIVAALSAPLLGERVPPSHWVAVAAGFAGALIVLRPGAGALQLAGFLPLCAAFLFALFQITTRVVGRTDPPQATLFFTFATGTVVTTAVAPFVWITPEPIHWVLLAATGVLSGFGHLFLIKALTAAPAATVSPFGYTGLVWATLYSSAIFGDVPSGWMLLGAALIVASGIYVFRSEGTR